MNRPNISRRSLLGSALFALPAALHGARANFELVIRNGRVIDPAQKIDRIADVGIRDGKIAEISAKITAAAAESIDAQGKLVVPGLIDIHLHARDNTLLPPEILSTGVTSMVDGGSRGADNLASVLEIARNAPNRMRILINISRLGNNPNPDPARRGEFMDGLDLADIAKARAAIEQNRQWVIGMKARLSRNVAANHDLEVLRAAVEAATPSGIPIMIHMGDTASPLPEILKILRPGDIVTHLYAPPPHGIQDDAGNILPEVRAARKRGILFDFGNGRVEHWTWAVAQSALKQGFPPDTISTDLEINGRTDQVFDLPTVMSKFLALGMPLNQVIACVTSNAARSFRELNPYGTLRKGAAADVTILELTSGDFEFVDNYKGTRKATRKLVTRGVVVAGKRVG